MARGTIWVGDLARALGQLQPDAEALKLLVTQLQLTRLQEQARLPAPPPVEKPPEPPAPPSLLPGNFETSPSEPRAPPTAFPSELSAATELVVRPPETRDLMAPPHFGTAVLLPTPKPLPSRPPSHKALVPRRWRTGIVSAALATHIPEGEVDLPRLIETFAARRPLARFPRRDIPTLRRGAQVLLDFTDGMLPFVRDRDDLVSGLLQTVGTGRIDLQHFADCPTRGVGSMSKDEKGERPWHPPPSGTPVVLLTNLGLGGDPLSKDRAMPDEWLDFAQRVWRARCPLVVFVPYEPSRIPLALREAFRLITWDRTTTATQARRAVERARRRR